MTVTLLVGALTGAVAILYSPVAQDIALDKAVHHVAVVWLAEGREAAQTQLDFELANVCQHQALAASDCVLEGGDGGARTVRCDWDTRVAVPFSDLVIPLAFRSNVAIAENGDVR